MSNRVIVNMQETKTGFRYKIRKGDTVAYENQEYSCYFYVLEEDFDDVQALVYGYLKKYNNKEVISQEVTDSITRKVYKKVFLEDNDTKYFVRKILNDEQIKHFEIDIPAQKRFLIDNQDIPLNQKGLKIAWYDCETWDLDGFVKDDDDNVMPVFPILSIAVKEYDHDTDKPVKYFVNPARDESNFQEYIKLRQILIDNPTDIVFREKLKKHNQRVKHWLFQGEKLMLEAFVEHIKQFDVLSGYNSAGFDYPYVKERCSLHKIPFDDLMMVDMDYMLIFKKNNFDPMHSFKLGDVAFHVLESELDNPDSDLKHKDEITKIDWKEKTKATKFFDLYCCYPELLEEYNIQDVQLLDMIEKKLNYFNIHIKKSEYAHCPLWETQHNSLLNDYLALNEYVKIPCIRPSKPDKKERDERDKKTPSGGFTFCYLPDLHWNVYGYDFSGHYLNIIRTFNISPETFKGFVYPDLTRVFTEKELEYIEYCCEIKKKYISINPKTKNLKLNNPKYENDIESKRKELNVRTMEELMWQFYENYDQKVEHKTDVCVTPADMNRDAKGWEVHPHVFYEVKRRGVYPKILDRVGAERQRLKEMMEKYPKGSVKWKEHFDSQYSVKTIGNGMFGGLLLKSFRDYNYYLGNSIPSSARYFTKKCIIETRKQGMVVTNGDTDSCYCKGTKTREELNKAFKKMLDEEVIKFNTLEYDGKKHTINFEFEKDLIGVVVVKKKRYYYLYFDKKKQKNVLEGVGGYMVRSDTNPKGVELQKELLWGILNKQFDKQQWREKLLNLKQEIIDGNLEEKYLIKTQGLSKPITEYGQPTIDGKTGQPKIKKDGTIQHSPIPANVQVAKQMIEDGYETNVGDKIAFIVESSVPKIKPVPLYEFRKTKKYDARYYHKAIVKPLLEILFITHPEDIFTTFKGCWFYTDKQIENLKEKLLADGEEDDSD